ncbi:MAG TPA: ATP-binding protein [Urbifossiella sp.]|nr:ATP-binding protein [Urbifossiella sp.]
MNSFRLAYLGPVVLIALCLVGLCAVTAVSLFDQQASLTRVLRENVESRRVAVELEECLTDLIDLENDDVGQVSVLHTRIGVLLRALGEASDQPEERDLYTRMAAAFAGYLNRWQSLPPAGRPDRGAARLAATRVLETDVLRPCHEFRQFNSHRIESSAEHHETVLRRLAWGLAVIGGLGAVAGLVLGYGVARGLTRSIRRLRVQLRDAAGILGPDLPEIVLTGEGDFDGLHAEVDRLTGRIEDVARTLRQRDLEVLRAEQLAAVGQLAAGVGHEIRNPLTSIKMLVQTGLEDPAGGLPADDLRVIEGEIRRMERSLRTFLDFARPPAPERRPTDLAALIAGVADLLRGRAEKQRVGLRLDLPPGGVVVTADGEQLRQVLVNLGLNALDAMPRGGELRFGLRRWSTGPVEIEAADTGPGIAAGVMPRLFEPFVSTKDTGLGLGLVISKRIVEEHGGTIAAANRPGGGASFFVKLPSEL